MMLSRLGPSIAEQDATEVDELVTQLARDVSIEHFKSLSTRLGRVAGRSALRLRELEGRSILLVTTAEDADDFSRAVFEQLTDRGAVVSKACFWLDRVSFPVAELGVGHRVVRSFVQPSGTPPDMIVFSRSIMDSKSEWMVVSSFLREHFGGTPFLASVIAGVVTGSESWPNGASMGEYLGFEPAMDCCAHDRSGLLFSSVLMPLHFRYGYGNLPSLWRKVPEFVASEMHYDPSKDFRRQLSSGPGI